ncbi:YwpF-like protein [Evansella caseinilytica]|uniref:YwpF-like protein n=1 Tax=Evansella caseinilytica TaxID=1503961 RepID=A0A1H3UAE2_9BACI|nr:YwpF-like family protein [Evansella caseinilytica]SDZ59061.1 YwpF-like protein [Evansella caseinilytica]
MKTFKLCSLAILVDDKEAADRPYAGKDIPLVDGLIINKEETRKNWFLDVVITKEWLPFFEESHKEQKQFMVEVTITKPTNDPATLVCRVKNIHELKEYISVHLDGVLVVQKDDLSDMLLQMLISEGYSGEALFEEFKRRKKDRGQVIQGILSNAYLQVKQKGDDDSESS